MTAQRAVQEFAQRRVALVVAQRFLGHQPVARFAQKARQRFVLGPDHQFQLLAEIAGKGGNTAAG
ncbi:MAG: hypothetical protein M5R36_06660 [Deltaproteobacteria bacterium]|nr:hypothetical protein [Deltaproteobacteria bacterium]